MAFIHLLLVIYALVYVNMELIDGSSSTEAVQCNMCVDRSNWTNCDDLARPRECSDQLVMATHGFLAQYNINLNRSSTVTDRQFRCFRLELAIDVATVEVFIRGCTYDDSFFCDGWTDNGAKATNCAVCSTKMCERNATGDVDPMTTTTYLPSETTTTNAVSTTETSSTTQSASSTHSSSTTQTTPTTKKASTTQSTSVTQSNPVTTTVTTDEPCIVDWTKTTTAKGQHTTRTTKVIEEVTSQPNNVTQSQDLTTNSTESAKNTPSPSDTNITPAASVETTTVKNGVEGKNFGVNMIVLVLLVSIRSIFIVKC